MKRGRKRKRRRGNYCGLLPVGFIAEMVGLSYFKTYRFLIDFLGARNAEPEEISPRVIGEFIEYVAQEKKESERDDDDIDDYIYV